ncbi:MAG: AIPR family protein [Deltaproteobacteria bacterium]|nr:AIPR family protein [Candidatus Zymogenaceae bacterium]
MLSTIHRILNKEIEENDVNDILWEKVNEIWDLFKNRHPKFEIYICSNKEKPIKTEITKFERSLAQYRCFNFHYFDQDDLVTRLFEKRFNKVDGSIHFIDKQYFERSDGDLKGIVATIDATELISIIKDPENPEKLIEDVFNENVRMFKELKNRINQSIFESALSDTNYEFWYLNNGITIVCEECKYTPNTRSPLVTLKNFQIVNGGQTTHTLFEAYKKDKEKISNVLLLVRICKTKDPTISERISESTNSQNPISTRDLHSNDRIQKNLEEQFQALGYFFERKKNQYADKPKKKRLDNELLGQIYLAYYLDMPSEAKNNKRLIFEEKYEEIFDENEISAKRMLLPYKIFLPLEAMKKTIQKKKREKERINEKDAFVSRAIFHILNITKYIAEKENLNLEKEQDIKKATKKAISYINEVVKNEIRERKELYTHDKFFKEIPTNTKIKNHVLSKYN